MRQAERENGGLMKPGQDLVAAGYAGYEGTVRIAEERRQELSARFTGRYIEQIIRQKELTEQTVRYEDSGEWKRIGAAGCEPAGEGGILTALWNLSGAYGLGIRFSLRAIPIRQETVELCEVYEINPYRLLSKGCLVLAADNGGDLAEAFHREGIPAAVIGKVTGGISRLIDHGESQGYLERPGVDEIYKVLEQTEQFMENRR